MGLADLRLPRAVARWRQLPGQPASAGSPAPGASRTGRRLRQLAAAAPFILPSLAGVVLFLLIPVVLVLLLSFVKWNFLQPPSWAGFANFTAMARYHHVFHSL